MKTVEFNKAAYAAYTTLSGSDQVKTDRLITAFAEEDSATNPLLANAVKKVSGSLEENLYAIHLTNKLRILVEEQEDRVMVVDILNHDLFVRYFQNVQAA